MLLSPALITIFSLFDSLFVFTNREEQLLSLYGDIRENVSFWFFAKVFCKSYDEFYNYPCLPDSSLLKMLARRYSPHKK